VQCKAGYSACATGCCEDAKVTAAKIASGFEHSCAVTSTGGVKCWGRNNNNGQLGNNSTADQSAVPVDVVGLSTGVVAVGLGRLHSCAVTSTGGVKCWGSNSDGALGNNSTIEKSLVPVDVQGLASGVVAFRAAYGHSCASTSTEAKCWGRNTFGQLGNESAAPSNVPVTVRGLATSVVALGLGEYHSCAVASGGGVKCWGYNAYGQLGNNSVGNNSYVPLDVQGLSSGVVALGVGGSHSCALTSSGGVKCWGLNDKGQLGNNSSANSLVPVDVQGLSSGVVAIDLGYYHSCAVISTGAVKCWGLNDGGQLGNNSIANSLVPVDVQGLSSGVVALGLGAVHSCAMTSTGRVKCWGSNGRGQLGNSTVADSPVPVDVLGF
jgi:alpha-tubulin suppressor-like RCC1 family protein